MSWSNPEIIKQLETQPAPPEDEAFTRTMEQMARMAASSDPSDMIQGRLVQACYPIMQEWGERGVMKRDLEFAALGAVGACRAFAILLANVLAVVPGEVAPRLKLDFDEQLAANVTQIRNHLARRSRARSTSKPVTTD